MRLHLHIPVVVGLAGVAATAVSVALRGSTRAAPPGGRPRDAERDRSRAVSVPTELGDAGLSYRFVVTRL